MVVVDLTISSTAGFFASDAWAEIDKVKAIDARSFSSNLLIV